MATVTRLRCQEWARNIYRTNDWPESSPTYIQWREQEEEMRRNGDDGQGSIELSRDESYIHLSGSAVGITKPLNCSVDGNWFSA